MAGSPKILTGPGRVRRSPGSMPGPMSRPGPSLLVPLVLIALVAAVYGPAVRFGFVAYDDPEVAQGPHVRGGLTAADLRWAVTGYEQGHWEPLTWWSLQADASAWHGRAGPMHAENVLLHAAGSCVLYGLLAAATGSLPRSAAVAALFAVHPMHVESVAWVTERRDVLSTPLLLAAVWLYVRYARARRRERAWYAAFLVAYALSLTAKATGMTMPVALLVLDSWPLRRSPWPRLLLEKVPVAILAGANAWLALAAQRAAGATSSLADLPLAARAGNAVVTTVIYVAKLAVPTGLAAIYPHPGWWPTAAVVAAGGLLGLVTAFAWRQRRRRPYLLAGWAWFVVTLLPTSGIAQSGRQAMADRYSYVPSIGLTVAAVWAAADAVPTPAAGASVAVAAVLGYGLAGRRQVGFWRDSDTLYARAAAVTGANPVADVGLGRAALARGDLAAAEARFSRAAGESPGEPGALAGLGVVRLRQGDAADAERLLAAAAAARPNVADYRIQHAVALSARPGGRAAAVAELRAALSTDPDNAAARAGLADLLSPLSEGRP